MSSRLSLATLGSLDPAFAPSVDPRELEVGIVHLGLGAFARAHGLVFTQAAVAATGDMRWGYCGVTQRSRSVIDQLAPQDGLYSVLVRSGTEALPQVVSTARDLLFAGEEPERLTERLAAPGTRVVTLTVTEKGYRHDSVTGRLRVTDPEVAPTPRAGRRSPSWASWYGAWRLGVRRSRAGQPALVRQPVGQRRGPASRSFTTSARCSATTASADWIADHVAFPSSMVDRITPATTAHDLAEVAAMLGVADEGVVVTEPFSQWVVQDTFAAGRPAWEEAGATLTADVAPVRADQAAAAQRQPLDHRLPRGAGRLRLHRSGDR